MGGCAKKKAYETRRAKRDGGSRQGHVKRSKNGEGGTVKVFTRPLEKRKETRRGQQRGHGKKLKEREKEANHNS